ncbi:hypothetical protein JCM5350_001792 [Sporobolomyces pararoseus]
MSVSTKDESSTTSDSEEDNSDSASNSSDSTYPDNEDSRGHLPDTYGDTSKRKRQILAGIAVSVVLVGLGVLLHTAEANSRQEHTSTSPQSSSHTRTADSSSSLASPTSSALPSSPTNLKALGVSRALPSKLRGVNLGSSLIAEFWMLKTTVEKLGCTGMRSEYECNEQNGLAKMQPLWEDHWSSFYSAEDFEEMKKLGLNAVRIPFGYWILDSLIGDDYFASGSFSFLKRISRWAKNAGLQVILDLHSVPGIAAKEESFAGRIVETPKFFSDENYGKACEVLTNLTLSAHTDDDFSSALTSNYYPRAQKAIREAEQGLGSWGSGDPTTHIDMNDRVFFDDHNYAQWIVTEGHTTDNYLKYACSNTRPVDLNNTITGEWSLSTIGIAQGLDQAFYRDFFSRQVANFERGPGWFFWSWKTEIDSPQWGYQQAVAAKYIPEDLNTLDTSACNDSWK